MIDATFYTYVYLDPFQPGCFKYGEYQFDYQPFYVGKGKNFRSRAHLSKAKHAKRKSHLDNKILKIISQGSEPIILKIKENITEAESFEYEKQLIKLIGRYDLNCGPLCNLSDGGDGQSGRIPWNKGKIMTEEYCQRLKGRSSWSKGKKIGPLSPERLDKIKQRVREACNHTRKLWILTSPEGEVFEVRGIKEFCDARGLLPSSFSRIANKPLTYHGWKCQRIESESLTGS